MGHFTNSLPNTQRSTPRLTSIGTCPGNCDRLLVLFQVDIFNGGDVSENLEERARLTVKRIHILRCASGDLRVYVPRPVD